MTKTKLLYTGLAGLMLGSFSVGTVFAKPAAPKAPELTLLKDVAWTPIVKEAGALPAMAPIQGDATKGAHTSYLKVSAGFESPPHWHTNDYWQVLIQGKMTHWAAEGGSEKDAKQLGVGDLTFMPGKVAHISKCYPGADCIVVIVQKGKSDFINAKVVAKVENKEEKMAAAPAAAQAAAVAPAKTPAAAPAPAATPLPAKK